MADAGAGFQAYEWLQVIGLSGLSGALGQGARVLVGLKKLQDAASSSKASPSDTLQPGRLIISLVIGFIAGSLAGLTIIKPGAVITVEQILGIAAAGYAGTDFIEGFVRRINGSGNGTPASGGTGAADDSSGQNAISSDGAAG